MRSERRGYLLPCPMSFSLLLSNISSQQETYFVVILTDTAAGVWMEARGSGENKMQIQTTVYWLEGQRAGATVTVFDINVILLWVARSLQCQQSQTGYKTHHAVFHLHFPCIVLADELIMQWVLKCSLRSSTVEEWQHHLLAFTNSTMTVHYCNTACITGWCKILIRGMFQ